MLSSSDSNVFFAKYFYENNVVLYGVGRRAKSFLKFHGNRVKLKFAVDRDKNKTGKTLAEIYHDVSCDALKDIRVYGIDMLDKLDSDVLVFVSISSPDEICRYLKKQNKNLMTYDEWYEKQKELFLKSSIDKYKIAFFMFEYGGHEKAITQKLLNYFPHLKIDWMLSKKRGDIPNNVKAVMMDDSYEYWNEVATSHIWVSSGDASPDFFGKKYNQYFIRVKHWASITLKDFGPNAYRSTGQDVSEMEKLYVYYSKQTDAIFVGSKFDEETCRSSFLYHGRYVHVGSSRSDILFDGAVYSEIKKKMGISDLEHTMLLAPTFRWYKDGNKDPLHGLDLELLHDSLKKKTDSEWKLLLRLHPYVASMSEEMDLPDYVIDVTDYDDSEELVAASDAMITDYSSIMFESAFIYRPVFLYAPDRKAYKTERDFLIDYDELPFPKSKSNQELKDAILSFDKDLYKVELKRFFEKYGVHEDGHASDRAAMYILGLLDAKG